MAQTSVLNDSHPPGRLALASRFRGHPMLTLLAVSIGVMMVGLDATVVAIANPAIASDLHADLAGLQWVTNGYLLALAVSLITAGRLADRFGRKKIFVVGVAGFALASVGVGLSTSIGEVITFRVIQGVAGALLQPASLAILRNTFPPEKLNMAIGIWSGTVGLAVASGPIVGGLLVQNVNWESVFFLNAPLAVIALAMTFWVVKESKDEQAPKSFDVPGVLLLSGTVFALIWALIKAQTFGFGNTESLIFFGVTVVLLAAFIAREHLAQAPLLPLNVFRNVSVSSGTVLVTLGFFALFGAFFFLTLYLQQIHGLDPIGAGVRLLPMTATFMVASPIAASLTTKFGPRPPLVLGMLATAGALFALSRLSVDASYIDMWPWFAVMGLGFGLVIVAGTEAIVGNMPIHLAGLAGGLQQTGSQLGGVLGTTVFGTLLATKVGDVLFNRLTGAGVPRDLAPSLLGGKEFVSQGQAPVPAGTSGSVARAITTGSHLAFMDGFRLAFIVGAIVALGAALAALLVRRGTHTQGGEGTPAPAQRSEAQSAQTQSAAALAQAESVAEQS